MNRGIGQTLVQGLGHPEVNHLDRRLFSLGGHQYIRRFDVAVNNAFLVGVLHR